MDRAHPGILGNTLLDDRLFEGLKGHWAISEKAENQNEKEGISIESG